MLIVWLMDADWGYIYIYIYLYEYDTPVAQTKNQQSCLATANSSLPDVLISPWRPHHALLPAQSRGKSAGAEWLTEWTIKHLYIGVAWFKESKSLKQRRRP